MNQTQKLNAAFRLYNASAGSGKTFALTVAFLEKILCSKTDDAYKKLLAITFTNKAVAEMKNRILDTLESFAKGNFDGSAQALANEILRERPMTKAHLQAKSQAVLIHLLHHYAQFHVETIDRFNHRLLKTFSKDLKLSSNFEVSLETGQLLSEAVDAVIDQAGRDPQITDLLVSFALNKTQDSKSWDIAYDLNDSAWMIVKENDAPYLAKFRDIPLQQFIDFTQKLREEKEKTSQTMQHIAQSVMELCQSHGILIDHLSRGTFIKILQEILDPKATPGFTRTWITKILEQDNPLEPRHPLYKTTAPKEVKAAVDELYETIVQALVQLHKAHISSVHINNTLSQLVPLTVVEAIEKEFERIKKENNTLVISDFNRLLSEEIQSQPAPFIYERLGERFTHYFIDEFQDTSALQWQNLLPLVQNNLAQADPDNPKHTLMLVGDAKQSIYRWRGGRPEQFIALASGKSQDLPPPEVISLGTNYRSNQHVVSFNNELYSFAADYLPNPEHTKLYKQGNDQNIHHKKDGFVSISFLDKSGHEADHKDEVYFSAIEQVVKKQCARGRSLSELCVLTRDNKKCSKIGAYLSEQGYAVVSEEALLIKNNPVVVALIDLGYLSANPHQKRPRARLGNLLFNTHKCNETRRAFLTRITGDNLDEFHELLSELGIDFDLKQMAAMGLYDRFAYALNKFGWGQSDNAYITQFMDWIYQYAKRSQATIWQLLAQWEQDKDGLSLSSGKGQDAIQIMTIHKAKGLEFPVVILPYAHEGFNPTKVGHIWYPYPEDGFDHLPVRYSKNLAQHSQKGKEIHDQVKARSFFDTLNLYYVATTRPTQELYVLCDKVSPGSKSISFNRILKDFLANQGRWVEDKEEYAFGSLPKIQEATEKSILKIKAPLCIVTPEQHPISMVPQRRKSNYWFDVGIGFGSLFHELMALVIHAEDHISAIDQISLKYRLDKEQRQKATALVKQTIEHPELTYLFAGTHQVYTERSIITPTGVLRPDRINMTSANTAVVLDYKTGLAKPEDEAQITAYGEGLKAMGINIQEHLIVYLREDPIIVNKL